MSDGPERGSRRSPWGHHIWFRPDDLSLDPEFLRSGVSWPRELSALAEVVPCGGLVVDIGASFGYLACYLSHLVGPEGHVHAFEPAADMHAMLSFNIDRNNLANITASRLAVGDRADPAELWISDTNLGRHSFHRINVPAATYAEQPPGIRMDDYWHQVLGRRPVDLLKIDVEGDELSVLRSAGAMLDYVEHVWLEFWPDGVTAAGDDPYEILTLLRTHDFTVTWHDIVDGAHGDLGDEGETRAHIASLRSRHSSGGDGLSPILYLHAERQPPPRYSTSEIAARGQDCTACSSFGRSSSDGFSSRM